MPLDYNQPTGATSYTVCCLCLKYVIFRPLLSGNFGMLTAPFLQPSLAFLPLSPSYTVLSPPLPTIFSPIDSPYLHPFFITPFYICLPTQGVYEAYFEYTVIMSFSNWIILLPCLFCLVLTDTREKYDGTRRSPWNEIECGDHYVRPMAAFSFFEIASGQVNYRS